MHGINSLIERKYLISQVLQSLEEAPVTVLLGARQSGKTTLARMVSDLYRQASGNEVHYFDLETPSARAALSTPELTLQSLEGLVVIDEIQRLPQLFEILRPLSDRRETPAHFLILGSASPYLIRGVSESLAGRCLFVPVPGFSLEELGAEAMETLWTRGGLPRSWLAANDCASMRWRRAFITTFLERDIPQLGLHIPSESLRRFWTMIAHSHAKLWNASELARSLSLSSKTVLSYRDILSGSYMLRVLPPWLENLKKRQVKSPKIYIRDSGLLHALLGISDRLELGSHPEYGASWEGFALEQLLAAYGHEDAYFWNTLQGAELDLLLFRDGRRFGFEFKCSDAPTMTKSMHIALTDLGLKKLFAVYPGQERYPIHEKAEAVPLHACLKADLFQPQGRK
ncbi:MAG: ATP-binding protein [Candidatus Wallbacteria bacterium]|nr:ATP-binding protein [Candidatus Wallbacteria bacterium]